VVSFGVRKFEILHTSFYWMASWSSGNAQASYSGVACSNLDRYIGYLDTAFRGLPQSLQVNSADRFLTDPFRFVSRLAIPQY
jgi:hypothetical protein